MNQSYSNRGLVKLIEAGLYAALIVFAITYLRIPMPGKTMVHVGNALVVLSVLLMGFKRGAVASLVGLFIFDILSGYAASVAFTLLEAVLVLVVVSAVYTGVFKRHDSHRNIVLVAVVAGLVKIVSRPFSIAVQQFILGTSWQATLAKIAEKMPATFFTAIVTAVLVGILYYPMKKAVERLHPVGE